MPVICLCYRQKMQSKLLFYFIVAILLCTGIWGLWQIASPDFTASNARSTASPEAKTPANVKTQNTSKPRLSITTQTSTTASKRSEFSNIKLLIDQHKLSRAVAEINTHYSSLNGEELEDLKLGLIDIAFSQSINSRKDSLLLITSAFDSVDIWQLLGDAAISDNDWNLAYRAQLRASELQNDPIELTILLNKLSISSSHVRKTFELSGDLISIKKLYQELSDLHPSFTRFSYELAISMINLGELLQAKPKLEALSYDPELGSLAQQALGRIEQELDPEAPNQISENSPPNQAETRSNDIVVPLLRAGSSFLVNTTIEQNQTRLLLDTGASITSLSSDLIRRLKLEDTGRSIRLSTANGVTSSRLYKVDRLKLGSVELRNMIVAEISLSDRSSFAGLLGTDALNQLAPEYNYLIDNQKAALIFRKSN